MPIYTDNPYDDGFVPHTTPLMSSIGIGLKVTKAIDAATKDWLDEHPEATTTVQDGSLRESKLKPSFSLELCRVFDIVTDMQRATDLSEGMICHTNGFHTSGDGGAAWYTISANGTENDMDVLACANNMYATLVVTETYVTPEMFGAYGDGDLGSSAHDDSDVFKYLVDNKFAIKLGEKCYWLAESIVTNNSKFTYINLEGVECNLSRYNDIGINEHGSILRISEPFADVSDTYSLSNKGLTGHIAGIRFVNVDSTNSSVVKTKWLLRCNCYSFLFYHNSTNGFLGAFMGHWNEVCRISDNKFQQLETYFFYGSIYDGEISFNHIQGVNNVPSTPNGSIAFYVKDWNIENILSNNYIDYWNFMFYLDGVGKKVKSINNQYGNYARIIYNTDSKSRTFYSYNDYFADNNSVDENQAVFTIHGYHDNIHVFNPTYSDNITTFLKLLEDIQSGTELGDVYVTGVKPSFFDLIDLNGHKIPISGRNFNVEVMFIRTYTTDTLPSVSISTYKGERRIFNSTNQHNYRIKYVGGSLVWLDEDA